MNSTQIYFKYSTLFIVHKIYLYINEQLYQVFGYYIGTVYHQTIHQTQAKLFVSLAEQRLAQIINEYAPRNRRLSHEDDVLTSPFYGNYSID